MSVNPRTRGFAADQIKDADEAEDWISAAAAVALLKPVTGSSYSAKVSLCTRAHAGIIRARAAELAVDNGKPHRNVAIPRRFWWAEGAAATLIQNWELGDFETWVEHETRVQVFGVEFARADVEKLVPPQTSPVPATATPVNKGGRPPADYWDDLWVEICRQLYVGELIPKRQSDIENAMVNWLAHTCNEHPSTSTIRPRAAKLWRTIEGEN